MKKSILKQILTEGFNGEQLRLMETYAIIFAIAVLVMVLIAVPIKLITQ